MERAETRNARVVELHMSRLREVKLQRQLEDRTAQVETLAAYAAGLEEKADELVSQAKMREEDSEKLRASWRGDRMLLVEERNEKEWRQRARADEREADGLRKEVEGMREMEVVDRESRKMGEWVEKERRSRWRAEKKEMQRDYEVVEGECVHPRPFSFSPSSRVVLTTLLSGSTWPSIPKFPVSNPSYQKRPPPSRSPPTTSSSPNPTSPTFSNASSTRQSDSRASWRSRRGLRVRRRRRRTRRGRRRNGLWVCWRRRGLAKER